MRVGRQVERAVEFVIGEEVETMRPLAVLPRRCLPYWVSLLGSVERNIVRMAR